MCRATVMSGSLIVGTTYQSDYQSDGYERSVMSVKRRRAVFQFPYTGDCVCKQQHQCMQWFPSTILPLEMQRAVTSKHLYVLRMGPLGIPVMFSH